MKTQTKNTPATLAARAFLPWSHVSTFSFSSWHLEQVTAGRFICNRYFGDFIDRNLSGRAATGLWYCRATGTGLGLEGEGATPQAAWDNLNERAREMRDEISRVYEAR
jgi:hypothetical protein